MIDKLSYNSANRWTPGKISSAYRWLREYSNHSLLYCSPEISYWDSSKSDSSPDCRCSLVSTWQYTTNMSHATCIMTGSTNLPPQSTPSSSFLPMTGMSVGTRRWSSVLGTACGFDWEGPCKLFSSSSYRIGRPAASGFGPLGPSMILFWYGRLSSPRTDEGSACGTRSSSCEVFC